MNYTELRAETHQLLTQGVWVGWCWNGKKWVYSVRADSLAEASRLLSQVVDARGIKDSCSCLTRGNPPSWRPPERKG
jgi:hypothetical protein